MALKFDVQAATATGTTASGATNLTCPGPCMVTATGVSGAGVNLPASVTGTLYIIKNMMAGDLHVYGIGSTINGFTGTLPYTITATGSKMALAFCVTAGQWVAGLLR